jgi:hypothetical protein
MKLKNIAHIAPLLLTAAMLFSCSTSRKVQGTGSATAGKAETKAAAAYATKVTDNAATATCLSARASYALQAGSKDISLGGTLRMKKDDVIRLSMTFLGMEVVRMEFTPDKVLVIDRFNKQYVEASYSDAALLRSASLDFYTLQALFWDELFYPGKRNVKEALSEYAISSSGEHTLLSLTSAPKLNYDFLTLTASHLIDRVSVTPKNTQATESLVCKYGDFASFSGKKFPTSISIVAKGGKRDVNLGITLSRLSDDSKWETRTTVPSNYKKRNIEDVLSQLSRIQ